MVSISVCASLAFKEGGGDPIQSFVPELLVLGYQFSFWFKVLLPCYLGALLEIFYGTLGNFETYWDKGYAPAFSSRNSSVRWACLCSTALDSVAIP